MKAAISLPNMYVVAARLTCCTGGSRSRLRCNVLKQYLARYSPDKIAGAMDRTCAETEGAKDTFISSAARRTWGPKRAVTWHCCRQIARAT